MVRIAAVGSILYAVGEYVACVIGAFIYFVMVLAFTSSI